MALFFSGCATQVSLATRSIAGTNHFQDGKTIGKNKSNLGFALGNGQHIRSVITKNCVDSIYYFENTSHSSIFMLTASTQNGVTDNFDVLLETNISLASIAGKVGFKYALTNPGERFSLAFMPYIGYAVGFTNSDQIADMSQYCNFDVYSHNTILEMNFPMSYYLSKDFSILCGLGLTKNFYNSSASDDASFSNQFFIPSVTLGLRMIKAYHQVRFSKLDDHFEAYYGMMLKFNLTKK